MKSLTPWYVVKEYAQKSYRIRDANGNTVAHVSELRDANLIVKAVNGYEHEQMEKITQKPGPGNVEEA